MKKKRAWDFSNLCANLRLALKTWKCKLRFLLLRSTAGYIRTITIGALSLNQKKKKWNLCSSEHIYSIQQQQNTCFSPTNAWDVHEEKPYYGIKQLIQKNCRVFSLTTKSLNWKSKTVISGNSLKLLEITQHISKPMSKKNMNKM